MNIEPVTQAKVDSLIRCVGGIGAMIARLGDVDLKRGRGVLEGNNRCLWTNDGCRITIDVASDGGLCVACDKDADPEAPQPQETSAV